MKKKGMAYLGLLMMVMVVSSGCSKDKVTKNTYRDSGIEYMEAGNYSEARASFETALSLSKGKVGDFEKDVLKYRAEAEFLMEDYHAAAETYEVLAEIDKGKTVDDKSEYRYLMNLSAALSHDGNGDYSTALTFYEAAVESGRANGDVYNLMGLCKIKEGDYEEAIVCFQDGISVANEANMAALLYNEATAYEYLGDFEVALEKFEHYAAAYGADEDLQRELDFLRTR